MEKPEIFQENVRLVSVPLIFIKYNSLNEVKNVFQQKFQGNNLILKHGISFLMNIGHI